MHVATNPSLESETIDNFYERPKTFYFQLQNYISQVLLLALSKITRSVLVPALTRERAVIHKDVHGLKNQQVWFQLVQKKKAVGSVPDRIRCCINEEKE
jgi:hypothetical protein